ncbi:MAG: hypothetical protein CMJ78_26535 [Planctomycetaceae bacterium]|nr:hypothetical protein [Planctomycetaceae bacterium]
MPEIIELQGTPYEMGCQHGELLAGEIRELADIRLTLAREFAEDHGVSLSVESCLDAARQFLPFHEQYSAEVMAEWQGIADGASLPVEEVFFANALTDFQDTLWQAQQVEVHGCTSFAISSEATVDGSTYIGQTWDMHASAEPFIRVFRRRPAQGPSSLTMTTSGCLTLVGVNEAGIAIGNNNLRPTDARPGVVYLAMMHRALKQTDWRTAVNSITGAYRASGHNYVMAHESGARSNIETTATRYFEDQISTPKYVHSNHYLDDGLRELEDPTIDRGSTEHRLARLRQALAENSDPLTPEGLRPLLSDHDGGEPLGICRHGTGHGARSCAFVVAEPADRSLWVSIGPPCEGTVERCAI